MPPKLFENDQAKILCDFQIQTVKMAVGNQLDIVVVYKRGEEGCRCCNPKYWKHQEERTLEAQKIPRAERGAGKDGVSKDIGGTSGDRSTRGCNPQAGRHAPTNPRTTS